MTLKIAIDATATPHDLVGAGYYVKELIILLDQDKEIELHIVTRKNDAERFKSFAPNANIYPISPNSIAARIVFQSYKLGVFVDALGVDIFHGPHYQIPLKMRTKSAVTIHDTTFLTHKSVHHMLKAFYFSLMIPFAVKKSSAIIAVSESSAKDVKDLYGINEKVHVAYHGVNTNRFFPYVDKSDDLRDSDKMILSNRGITGEFLGFLGLLEPRKSVPTLIAAFSSIAKEFPNLKLVIAGSNAWGIEKIREAVNNSGFSSRIILTGRLSDDEIRPFLCQSKVFVYPSLYEGFGLPVLEAMACGTPTITTNSSSLSEVAGYGENAGALMFRPGDVDDLSALLRALLNDEALLADCSKKAIARAANFSWEKCATDHIAIYKAAITSKN